MTDTAKKRIDKELKEKTGKLNLRFCKLDRIPIEVIKMTWLTKLDLFGNQISKLEGLEGLSSLIVLNLSSNQIIKLEGLEGLSSLRLLSLSSNQIIKLEGLEGLSSLKVLNLFNNQISKLEGLKGLSSLNMLDLADNQITKLEGLEGLSSLTLLNLSSNQIIKLEGLEGLSSLTVLSLSSNQISKLEGLVGLSSLNTLDLSSNQIIKLEGLEGLSSLNMLDLDGNQIIKLEGLEGLSSLTKLYLSSNQISKLEGLEGLSSLNMLDLAGNQIIKLEGLEGLSSLTELKLFSNQISKLEGLEGLSSLNILDLAGNQISKLEGLEGLSSLTVLYLSSNQISKLEGLEGLSSLKELKLFSNQISKLEGLEGLLNLGVLDFENNPIPQIETECQAFASALPFLDLKGTKIKDISFSYQDIKQGKRILWEDVEIIKGRAPDKKDYYEYTRGNDIFHVKRGINVKECNELDAGLIAAIQNGQDALLAYIEEPKERLFEARVLVLGEPRAGKTTLRRKLLDVGTAMPTEQESTKAFEIEVAPYECAIELNEQIEKLRYYLWDFGGQDYYRLLHQLFVTEQSVYIIVVDTDRNKNEEEIAFWLDTIERLGKDDRQHYGPVILFQNPKNRRPGGTFTDLKKRYPFWQQTDDFIINLNALNEQEAASFDKNELVGFKNFEKYLSRSFCRLDHVGKEIPIKWIAVRDALLAEKENWISVEHFYKVCSQNGITEKEQRTSLLDIFRQLGYLLHYKNTTLKGMVILNREWVTDALYRVLDDKIVEVNKGWFSKEDTEKIWHEEKYENRTEELLALMQEFKLCYQNPTTKKYIVPSKLPSSVDNLPVWDTTNNVRLRLQYDWMPKALAIQLLVSLHEYIISLADGEQWIWRKGAVLDGKQLELQGVQVRIRDEYDDKRIAIDAKGAHSETLFRTIMKKWKEVNEPFEDKVKVTPIILCPCITCTDLDTPHTFSYQSVLNAKQQKQTLQCNESFTVFKAEDILKGVYDETTVLLDSIKGKNKEHSRILDLIRADELDKAIASITSPEYTVLFERRLQDWNRNNRLGNLTFDQKSKTRNDLAQDLVEYFFADTFEERKKKYGDIDKFPGHFNPHDYPAKDKGTTPIQVTINNTIETKPQDTPTPVSETPRTESKTIHTVSKHFYEQWWFVRIIGAIILGVVVSYFANKYGDFHFGDTWLGLSSLVSAIFLWRNPKRVYLRLATCCVMAIAGINIFSQIDFKFNITDISEETRPWDFLFKFGFGEKPTISVILGIIAVVLFVLDYLVRKENL